MITQSQILGANFCCLSCKEVENLLTPGILEKSIVEREGKNDTELNFDNLRSIDYKNLPLGEFITEKITGIKRTYDSNGTIYKKDKFAKAAVSFMNDTSDMSDEAIKLAEKLHEFIKRNNS